MDQLVKEESQKLLAEQMKQARIQRQIQVRQQAMAWSDAKRKKFEEAKERQIKKLTAKVTEEAQAQAIQNIQRLNEFHDLAMSEIGMAHRAAAGYQSVERLKSLKRLKNEEVAKNRGSTALMKLNKERESLSAKSSEILIRKKEVRKLEDQKSQEIISRRPLALSNPNVDTQIQKIGPPEYQQSLAKTLTTACAEPERKASGRAVSTAPSRERIQSQDGERLPTATSTVIDMAEKEKKQRAKSHLEEMVRIKTTQAFGGGEYVKLTGGPKPETSLMSGIEKRNKYSLAVGGEEAPRNPYAQPSREASVRYFDAAVPNTEVKYLAPEGLAVRESRTSPDAWEKGRQLSEQLLLEQEERDRKQQEMARKQKERGEHAILEERLVKEKQDLEKQINDIIDPSNRPLDIGSERGLFDLNERTSQDEDEDVIQQQKHSSDDFLPVGPEENYTFPDTIDSDVHQKTQKPKTLKSYIVTNEKSKPGSGTELHLKKGTSDDDLVFRRDVQPDRESADLPRKDSDTHRQAQPPTTASYLDNDDLKTRGSSSVPHGKKVPSDDNMVSRQDVHRGRESAGLPRKDFGTRRQAQPLKTGSNMDAESAGFPREDSDIGRQAQLPKAGSYLDADDRKNRKISADRRGKMPGDSDIESKRDDHRDTGSAGLPRKDSGARRQALPLKTGSYLDTDKKRASSAIFKGKKEPSEGDLFSRQDVQRGRESAGLQRRDSDTRRQAQPPATTSYLDTDDRNKRGDVDYGTKGPSHGDKVAKHEAARKKQDSGPDTSGSDIQQQKHSSDDFLPVGPEENYTFPDTINSDVHQKTQKPKTSKSYIGANDKSKLGSGAELQLKKGTSDDDLVFTRDIHRNRESAGLPRKDSATRSQAQPLKTGSDLDTDEKRASSSIFQEKKEPSGGDLFSRRDNKRDRESPPRKDSDTRRQAQPPTTASYLDNDDLKTRGGSSVPHGKKLPSDANMVSRQDVHRGRESAGMPRKDSGTRRQAQPLKTGSDMDAESAGFPREDSDIGRQAQLPQAESYLGVDDRKNRKISADRRGKMPGDSDIESKRDDHRDTGSTGLPRKDSVTHRQAQPPTTASYLDTDDLMTRGSSSVPHGKKVPSDSNMVSRQDVHRGRESSGPRRKDSDSHHLVQPSMAASYLDDRNKRGNVDYGTKGPSHGDKVAKHEAARKKQDTGPYTNGSEIQPVPELPKPGRSYTVMDDNTKRDPSSVHRKMPTLSESDIVSPNDVSGDEPSTSFSPVYSDIHRQAQSSKSGKRYVSRDDQSEPGSGTELYLKKGTSDDDLVFRRDVQRDRESVGLPRKDSDIRRQAQLPKTGSYLDADDRKNRKSSADRHGKMPGDRDMDSKRDSQRDRESPPREDSDTRREAQPPTTASYLDTDDRMTRGSSSVPHGKKVPSDANMVSRQDVHRGRESSSPRRKDSDSHHLVQPSMAASYLDDRNKRGNVDYGTKGPSHGDKVAKHEAARKKQDTGPYTSGSDIQQQKHSSDDFLLVGPEENYTFPDAVDTDVNQKTQKPKTIISYILINDKSKPGSGAELHLKKGTSKDDLVSRQDFHRGRESAGLPREDSATRRQAQPLKTGSDLDTDEKRASSSIFQEKKEPSGGDLFSRQHVQRGRDIGGFPREDSDIGRQAQLPKAGSYLDADDRKNRKSSADRRGKMPGDRDIESKRDDHRDTGSAGLPRKDSGTRRQAQPLKTGSDLDTDEKRASRAIFQGKKEPSDGDLFFRRNNKRDRESPPRKDSDTRRQAQPPTTASYLDNDDLKTRGRSSVPHGKKEPSDANMVSRQDVHRGRESAGMPRKDSGARRQAQPLKTGSDMDAESAGFPREDSDIGRQAQLPQAESYLGVDDRKNRKISADRRGKMPGDSDIESKRDDHRDTGSAGLPRKDSGTHRQAQPPTTASYLDTDDLMTRGSSSVPHGKKVPSDANMVSRQDVHRGRESAGPRRKDSDSHHLVQPPMAASYLDDRNKRGDVDYGKKGRSHGEKVAKHEAARKKQDSGPYTSGSDIQPVPELPKPGRSYTVMDDNTKRDPSSVHRKMPTLSESDIVSPNDVSVDEPSTSFSPVYSDIHRQAQSSKSGKRYVSRDDQSKQGPSSVQRGKKRPSGADVITQHYVQCPRSSSSFSPSCNRFPPSCDSADNFPFHSTPDDKLLKKQVPQQERRGERHSDSDNQIICMTKKELLNHIMHHYFLSRRPESIDQMCVDISSPGSYVQVDSDFINPTPSGTPSRIDACTPSEFISKRYPSIDEEKRRALSHYINKFLNRRPESIEELPGTVSSDSIIEADSQYGSSNGSSRGSSTSIRKSSEDSNTGGDTNYSNSSSNGFHRELPTVNEESSEEPSRDPGSSSSYTTIVKSQAAVIVGKLQTPGSQNESSKLTQEPTLQGSSGEADAFDVRIHGSSDPSLELTGTSRERSSDSSFPDVEEMLQRIIERGKQPPSDGSNESPGSGSSKSGPERETDRVELLEEIMPVKLWETPQRRNKTISSDPESTELTAIFDNLIDKWMKVRISPPPWHANMK